jgi:hypothetical protein
VRPTSSKRIGQEAGVSLWASFQYREFYDVPRQIIVRHRGRTFLLDCRFDETRDDYDRDYEVFDFPDLAPDLLRFAARWI